MTHILGVRGVSYGGFRFVMTGYPMTHHPFSNGIFPDINHSLWATPNFFGNLVPKNQLIPSFLNVYITLENQTMKFDWLHHLKITIKSH